MVHTMWQLRAVVRILVVFCFLSWPGFAGTARAAPLGPVLTASGPLLGVASPQPSVTAFKGIPYAASTAGAARWRPPRAPTPWQTLRRADHFGAKCPQASRGLPGEDDLPQSEDCLFLNVWTPARSRNDRLPVMVWVHGGAYIFGSGANYSDGWRDPSGLAAQGVVLVTLNHRLGIFGFLAHPELAAESPHHSAGNYGVLDVIAALRWVRTNIAAFGGDPGNVTIFGHSSGSGIVTILLAAPEARGLFQRAIAESGASLGFRSPKPLAVAMAEGAAFARRIGAHDIAALRARPAESLVSPKPGAFEPVVDPWVYPRSLYRTLAARAGNEVPLLVGSTSDEGQYSPSVTALSYVEEMHRRYGAAADEVLARYPATSDEVARRSSKAVDTLEQDAILTTLADLAHCAPSHGGLPRVFQYRFEHAPPAARATDHRQGAYHGAEIAYVFHALGGEPRAWTKVDRRLERLLSGYWVNFARTGDVNGPGLPHWPSWREQEGALMRFGDDARVTGRENAASIALLQQIYYGAPLHSCGR
jgi:para-nitrobenzyl esterase